MTENGSDQPLPEHRQKQVEAGLATYQSVLAERDLLERELRQALAKIDSLDQQLSSMHGIVNMMESSYISAKADLEGRVKDYQQQRDEAVARVSSFETLFATMQAQLRVFVLPSVPLVKEVADATQLNASVGGRAPDSGQLAGSGQRAAVPHPSTSQGQVPRSAPVLAHDQSVLGQRAGEGPRAPKPPRRIFPGDPTS